MPTRPKNYHRPQSLDEALTLLSQPDSAPLGGGTRLLAGDVTAATIVDLQDLGLGGIRVEDMELHIGAVTTLAGISDSAHITGEVGELLRQAIKAAGPNTFRNAATLGGLIGSRESSSELLTLLLALNAELKLAGANTESMSLDDYLTPDDRPDGLITEVAARLSEGKGAIHRVARTPADAPIVAVAAWRPEGAMVGVAAVGINARPTRLSDAGVDDTAIESVIAAAQQAVTHAGDFLGSAEYRREMVGVLLRRALMACK